MSYYERLPMQYTEILALNIEKSISSEEVRYCYKCICRLGNKCVDFVNKIEMLNRYEFSKITICLHSLKYEHIKLKKKMLEGIHNLCFG